MIPLKRFILTTGFITGLAACTGTTNNDVPASSASLPASSNSSARSSTATTNALAINVGGSAFTDSQGVLYSADNNNWANGGTARLDTESIDAPDGELYQSERWGQYDYQIPLANGHYDVWLHFAETSWEGNATGKRIMNIALEGVVVETQLDIFTLAGGRLKPLIREYRNINVQDGALSIDLTATADNATLAGIRISAANDSSVQSQASVSSVQTLSSQSATSEISSAFTSSQSSNAAQPSDPIAGAGYYDQLCSACHGINGSGPIPITITQLSQDALTHIIDQRMPTAAGGGPQLCQGRCASDTAAYLLSWQPMTPAPQTCSDPNQHSNTPLRLLTQQQLKNQLRDIFSPATLENLDELTTTGDDVAVAGFANNANTAISTDKLRALIPIMANIAAQISAQSDAIVGCSPSNSCFNTLFSKVRGPLFKGRLSNARAQSIKALMQNNSNAQTGFEQALLTMLLAPEFLYSYELASPERRPLTGMELADKLALLIWQSAPDAALISAAQSNNLNTTQQLQAQVERMLANPKAIQGIKFFYQNWLAIHQHEGAANEMARFALWLTQNNDNFSALFTSRIAFLDEGLANIYDITLANNSNEFMAGQQVILGEQRAGLLTRAGYLKVGGQGEHTKPTVRGKHFRQSILCQNVPSPGAEIQSNFPILPSLPSLTEVEKLEQFHLTVDGCNSCHNWIDPLGFGFEAFDGNGHYRTEYTLANGTTKPVRSAGEIIPMPGDPSDLSGHFDGVIELSHKVANSNTARACFSQMWFQNAMLRNVSPEDACALKALTLTFAEQDYSLRGLISAIATSDAFRYRNADNTPSPALVPAQ